MSVRLRVPDPLGMPPGLPPEIPIGTSLPVRAWVDDVYDTLGFDPRSAYVERFWLGILGPSTTWLLRRLAARFDREPGGFELPLADTARELGLGDKGGRHSPFMRAVWRCCLFDLARLDEGTLEVRRRLPPLNRRQLQRTAESTQAAHHAWQEARLGQPAEHSDRRRARVLALTLLEVDADRSAVEQRLTTWGVHPAAAFEATEWAWQRHTSVAET
jgi:hypothetical protein